MKKNDVILIVIILAIAAGLFFMIQKNKSKAEPDWVVVSVGGSTEYARYPLNKDATYELEVHEGELNILQVQNGVATMTEANCSDQICVYQKGISQNGEMIVCLPHQLIVTIESSTEKTNDSVAN